MSRFGPGVYTRDMANANLASSLSGFNITAVIGIGKDWKLVSNEEIIKSEPEQNTAGENEILLNNVAETFVGVSIKPYETWVLPITSSNEGYYKIYEQHENYEDAKQVVSNDTENPKNWQIKLENVTPWRETEAVQIGDWVINVVDGDYLQRTEEVTGTVLVVPNLKNRDIIDTTNFKKVISLGTLPGLNQYEEHDSYFIVEHEGSDDDPDNGKAEIVWLFDNQYPQPGSSFYVTYQNYKTDVDYEPKYMYSTEAIVNEYGPEYDNGVVNSLSLAADLVIEGQTVYGGGVLCCQVKGNNLQDWKNAIDKLDKKVFNTYILTNQSDADGNSLQSYLKQKIETLSSITYKSEKTAFFIPPFSYDIQETASYREALNYDRITLFANRTCTVELVDNTTLETVYIELPAIYACANLSGIEGNPEYTFSEPMLRKKLSTRITFNEDQRFNPSEMFSLDNNGVSIFDMDLLTNRSYVYTIGTTDVKNVMTETRAVRRETDLLRQNVRRNLDQYIGQKNKPVTAASATETTKAMLRNFVNIDEISGFRDVTSWFDEQEPRLLRQSFWYRPYLETRWIFVDIGTYI